MLESIRAVLQKIPLIGVCFKPKHPIRKVARETLLMGSMFVVQSALEHIGGPLGMKEHHAMSGGNDHHPQMSMPSPGKIYGKMFFMMCVVAYTRNIVMSIAIQLKRRGDSQSTLDEEVDTDWRDHIATKTLVKTLPLLGNFADKQLLTQKTRLEIGLTITDEAAMLTLGTLTMALPPVKGHDISAFFIRYFRMLGGMGAGSMSIESLSQALRHCKPQAFSYPRGPALLTSVASE